MPDRQGNTESDPETVTDTSLHAYKDSREDDIKGDSDKLLHSDDREDLKASELEDPDESGPPKKA